jgi:hypothetical protein
MKADQAVTNRPPREAEASEGVIPGADAKSGIAVFVKFARSAQRLLLEQVAQVARIDCGSGCGVADT